MKCSYACQSSEHLIGRRQFLGGVAASAGAVVGGGIGALTRPVMAEQLAKQQKRVIVFNMHGGLSQLESWDPKPGTDTGGPFRAIATSQTGVHISELLPQTAKQMHRLAIIRSINTKENDHGKGMHMMLTGRKETPGMAFPQLGAAVAKSLSPESAGLPGHIVITPGGGGGRGNDSAYLGPKYASISLGNGNPPANSARPEAIAEAVDASRNDFRKQANERFNLKRRTAMTDAFVQSYDQAQQMMAQRDAFDVTKESDADQARYGKHDFGRHCLLARRLLERNVTFVQVTHSNYDTHNENFNFHLEQLGEWDQPFATLVGDLADRGMLESTLVVVLCEFGRTPNINHLFGRDHWGTAWSVLVGGAKVIPGAVIGKTNANGTQVIDREVTAGHLFHTYMQALGVDSTGSFDVGGRPMPIADPAYSGIKELIA